MTSGLGVGTALGMGWANTAHAAAVREQVGSAGLYPQQGQAAELGSPVSALFNACMLGAC